jgi:hypothetical protein
LLLRRRVARPGQTLSLTQNLFLQSLFQLSQYVRLSLVPDREDGGGGGAAGGKKD